jgi:hypothetical protein
VTADLPELRELADDFGGELLGVNEFAALVGFDRSTAAQLRAERKRDQAGFPQVVSESGRSFLHRLEDLIDWIEHSRYLGFVSIRDTEVANFRLERRMRSLIESIGVTPARQFLAALALAVRSDSSELLAVDPVGTLERCDDELVRELTVESTVSPEEMGLVVDELLRASSTPQVIDRAIVEMGTHQPGIPHRTADAPACLAALLLDAGAGHTVYEPTSGECEILLRVTQLADARGDQLGEIAASDIDPQASLIGRARLRLAGVDVRMDTEISPGTIDRLIIDPGSNIDRRALNQWVRLLQQDGRVVLITRISGANADLLAELAPVTILFPPQRPAGTQGAVALWVSHPLNARPTQCTIVDLRGSAPASTSTIRTRLGAVTDALHLRSCTTLLDADSSWQTALSGEVPSDPSIWVLPYHELEDRLAHAVAGTLGFTEAVVEANEQYALVLAKELERLIGGRSTGATQWAPLERPPESPDGVLASKTTDEARRVIARLADTFEGVRRWTRQQQ